MRTSVREILTSALKKEESPLFLSKNKKEIYKYLTKRGFDLKIEEIEEFLEAERSNNIVYRNDSERRKREVSRAMILAPDFFYWMHGDVAYTSKHRNYGNDSTKFILLLIDSLSLMTFLAPLKSTRSHDVISAFEFVFSNSDYLPGRIKRLSTDFGVEFRSSAVLSYLKKNGIRPNPIPPRRLERKGKGSPYAEQAIRMAKIYLNRSMDNDEKNGSMKWPERLLAVQKIMNNRGRAVFGGYSSSDMINQNPKHVQLLKHSYRISSRKYLKKNIANPLNIELYSIVKIQKYSAKENLGFKESHGSYGDRYYIVLKRFEHDFVNYFLLGNVHSLLPISNVQFSYYELKVFKHMTLGRARYMDCLGEAAVRRNDGAYTYFTVEGSEKPYYAVKNDVN